MKFLGRRGQEGITIVEVLMAIVVIGISIAGAIHTFVVDRQLDQQSKEYQLAVNGLRLMADGARSEPYASLASSWDGKTFAVDGLMPQDGNPSVGTVSVMQTTRLNVSGNAMTMLEVTITLQWKGLWQNRSLSKTFFIVDRTGG